jgi:hypothetical protein
MGHDDRALAIKELVDEFRENLDPLDLGLMRGLQLLVKVRYLPMAGDPRYNTDVIRMFVASGGSDCPLFWRLGVLFEVHNVDGYEVGNNAFGALQHLDMKKWGSWTRELVFFTDRSDHFWLAVGLLSIWQLVGRWVDMDEYAVGYFVGLLTSNNTIPSDVGEWGAWLDGWMCMKAIIQEQVPGLLVNGFACTMVGLYYRVIKSMNGEYVNRSDLVEGLTDLVAGYVGEHDIRDGCASRYAQVIIDGLNGMWEYMDGDQDGS